MCGLACDVNVRRRPDDLFQPAAHDRVIVCNQNPDHRLPLNAGGTFCALHCSYGHSPTHATHVLRHKFSVGNFLQFESGEKRRLSCTIVDCLFRLHEGSIRKEEIVEFLKALKAHLQQPLLVIWDGLKAHRSRLVRDYLDGLNGHIQIAFFPRMALTSIPSNICGLGSSDTLANYCPDDLSELHATARNKLKSAQKRPSIIAACWMQATL